MISLDNFRNYYTSVGINLTSGINYLNFTKDMSNIIKEQFKKQEELNFSVIQLYLQINNKFVN